jgi:hypothetical protein
MIETARNGCLLHKAGIVADVSMVRMEAISPENLCHIQPMQSLS